MELDREKLKFLLKDFHALTGITVAVFDEEGAEALCWPETSDDFCAAVRKNEKALIRCRECDLKAMENCRKSGRSVTYTCHMGLTETALPIRFEDAIIGYIMMGRVRGENSEFSSLAPCLTEYGIEPNSVENAYNMLSAQSGDKLKAAAHILEACACYMYLTKIVKNSPKTVDRKIAAFISDNLDKNLSVEVLLKAFRLSRIELYNIFNACFNTSVAKYIKDLRLKKAASLLRETELKVSEIAVKSGIPDYNYFTKLFKAEYSVTPLKYRKRSREQA